MKSYLKQKKKNTQFIHLYHFFILNKTEKKLSSKNSFRATFWHFNVQFTQFQNIGCTM